MAGGDIDVIFTADDRDVSAGIDKLKMKAGGFAAEWAKASGKVKEQLTGFKNVGPAVVGAIAASMGLATKAVMDYSEKNDLVAGSLKQLQMASTETWTAIGRDISGLLGGEAAQLIRWLERVRQGAVDGLAGLFSSDADEVGAQMKATEDMIKGAKDAAAIRRETMAIQASMLEADGKSVEAAKIRALMEKESTLQRIASLGLTDSAEKAQLIRLAEMKRVQTVNAAVAAAAAAEKDKEAKLMAEAVRGDKEERENREREAAEAKARQQAKERLDLELAAQAIDALKGTARKEEIQQMERELELRRRILDITNNELLTAQDKKDAVESLQQIAALELAGIKPETERARRLDQIEAGLNFGRSLAFAATGLGVGGAGSNQGGMLTVATQTRDAGVRTAKAVEKLVERGVVGRFS